MSMGSLILNRYFRRILMPSEDDELDLPVKLTLASFNQDFIAVSSSLLRDFAFIRHYSFDIIATTQHSKP